MRKFYVDDDYIEELVNAWADRETSVCKYNEFFSFFKEE